jgi:hypothetical protein
MEASQRGHAKAANDPGLVHTVWLLAQVPLAARTENLIPDLQRLGIQISGTPSLLEVIGAFTDAVDVHLGRQRNSREGSEQAALERQLQTNQKKLSNLLDAVESGIGLDTVVPRIREIEAENERLERKLTQLRQVDFSHEMVREAASEAASFMKNFDKRMAAAPILEQRGTGRNGPFPECSFRHVMLQAMSRALTLIRQSPSLHSLNRIFGSPAGFHWSTGTGCNSSVYACPWDMGKET